VTVRVPYQRPDQPPTPRRPTTEINYPNIAAALHEDRYTGVVGLEAWASGDSHTALQRFRYALTPPAQIRLSGLMTRSFARFAGRSPD
jgi:hypothetical protein